MALLADLLTLSRLFAAALLVWLGFRGPDTLSYAVAVAMLAWTTDQLDGWAARRAKTPTRLAPADFAIDTVLYAGTLAYLMLAGFVPWPAAVAFAAAALVISLIFRRKAIQVACIRLIDLATMVVIFTHRPAIGVLLTLWLVVLATLYRQRIAQRVPRWLNELRNLFGLSAALG